MCVSTDPDYFTTLEYEQKGVPIGRPAEVNLRNNHAQYIFTWYVYSPSPVFRCRGGQSMRNCLGDAASSVCSNAL